MSARRPTGVPLSVKFMLTTSIVVAIAVAIAAWSVQNTTSELARDEAVARRAAGEQAIVRESELLVRNIASASAIPLAQHAFGEIGPLLATTKAEYPRIQWIAIATEAGQPVAATPGAPTVGFADFPAANAGGPIEHARVAPDRPDWVYASAIRVDQQVVGQVRLGVSTKDLDDELEVALGHADARAQRALSTIKVIIAVVMVVGLILAAIIGIRTAAPLKQLARQAERIASGDLHERVPIERRDEIGALARSFNFMADQLGVLMIENANKASLERELALARDVQQGMLPPAELVAYGDFKLVGHCEPASSVGGDWWTFRRLTGGRLLLVIGDATGHGVHSAILASTARGAVEALAQADERLLSPEQVLRSIDAAIRHVGEQALMMTAFAAILDPNAGVIRYANAGQNFPYLLRMAEDRRFVPGSVIAVSGNPLGDRAAAADIRAGSIELSPGDLFVAFTDGVVERQAPTGKPFGDRRLSGVFTGRSVPTEVDGLTALRDEVRAAIEAYAAGTIASDDITFVLCHYDPPARPDRAAVASAGGAR